MKNKCRKLIFLLFSSSRVDLFVKKQNCRNLSLILKLPDNYFELLHGEETLEIKIIKNKMVPNTNHTETFIDSNFYLQPYTDLLTCDILCSSDSGAHFVHVKLRHFFV